LKSSDLLLEPPRTPRFSAVIQPHFLGVLGVLGGLKVFSGVP
jgi:hypothetical protein